MNFADLGLSDELLRAVDDSGYSEATPIQEKAIPSVLMGRDLIGIAQTGTGKTAAFVLPMIDILGNGRSRARMPRSLILEPTRELAAQVAENFEKYGKYHKLSMALLIGGVQMGDQIKALEKGVDVLIATPGRLMDLFSRGKILLTGCNLLVIDEADRMLDMGFIPDIEEIASRLPKQRQTLLFSATMPPPIQKLAAKFLSEPKTVEVARPATANVNIDQKVIEVRSDKKRDVLRELLRGEGVKNAIIFSNRKTMVRELYTSLKRSGFAVGQIHGDMEQSDRIAEFDRFKNDKITVLVASDVAARGLDVRGVSHVINFDVPWQPDDYVHRIGRTGRAGAKGTAITLATREDAEALGRIEHLTGTKIPRITLGDAPLSEVAAETEDKAQRRSRKPAGEEKAPRRGRSKAAEPKREPAAAQTERSPLEDAPIEKKPRRERARTERDRAEDARPRAEPAIEDAGEGGWNGPLPSFLSVSLS
ncbi:DEAD/DEAH box helicase [Sphingomonas sp. KRR8]|uniref:DEAD/DEAH box helicase n=1 Tax=Sphingomonas sp. KRR8 TaxID=2942996 RepID=UPI0020223C85|nr:DEAD/DEAH box helicase [Sphingomonas sp. KRR8]URD61498.1 DEAD/DEAH box helicase [Sphingomonas sp. KRR8]